MIKISIQFFGGRGAKSGAVRTKIVPGSYAQYNSESESDNAMGLHNGGEADKWMKSLNPDERNAVEAYSGSTYITLNDALREGTASSMSDYHKDIDKNLETALSTFTLDKPTTFVRGSTADLLGGASTVAEINAMKGQIVIDKGYTSSSTVRAFSSDIVYHINTPAGKGIGAYIKGLSHYTTENEFLFNKNSIFTVKQAYQKGSQVHVDIDYYGRMS